MTLKEALAYARSHQPAVLAALARIKVAKALADVPRAQWYPSAGATAQLIGGTANNTTASYVGALPEVDIPRIGATRAASGSSATWSPYASTFAAVGAVQEIFDFGRIAAQTAAADAQIDVSTQNAAVQELEIDFGVEEAYFAVYAAKAVLKSSEDAYERSREHRDLANAGVTSGLRSPIELTRAEADLGRFEVARIRARGNVVVAENVLAAAVGAPELAIDATGNVPTPTELPSLDAAISQAASKSPWMLEALANLHAQEEQTRAIGAELRPNLALSATLSGRAGGAPPSSGVAAADGGWIPNVPNWDVGLVVSWPLFDQTVTARQRASRVTEEARRDDLALVRQQTNATVAEAYSQVTTTRDALPALQRAVAGAVANYAQANARFNAGLGNAVELADAEALRSDAEIQVALGIFQVARARAMLGRALAEGL
jgi:outer membrane protein